MTKITSLLLTILLLTGGYTLRDRTVQATELPEIPQVHTNITMENDQLVFTDSTGRKLTLFEKKGPYTLDQLRTNPLGNDSGITFDFHNPELSGKVYFGLLAAPDKIRHSYPVFAAAAKIVAGVAVVNIKKELSGLYDFTNWQETGIIRLGYRVVNQSGIMLYDGKLMIAGTGPLIVDTS
ncbi:hypothetical protein ACFLQW_03940, partial [Candidatus Zixiibacteriota bacterium]